MNPEHLTKIRRVLKEIAEDMEHDASAFDGKPFNGRTVAEYFGNQGAAIAALAHIVDDIIGNISGDVHHVDEHGTVTPPLRGPIREV